MPDNLTIDSLKSMNVDRLISGAGDEEVVQGKTGWKGRVVAFFKKTNVSLENQAVWTKLIDTIKNRYESDGSEITANLLEKYDTSKPLSNRKAIQVLQEARGLSLQKGLVFLGEDNTVVGLALKSILGSDDPIILGQTDDITLKNLLDTTWDLRNLKEAGMTDDELTIILNLKLPQREVLSDFEDEMSFKEIVEKYQKDVSVLANNILDKLDSIGQKTAYLLADKIRNGTDEESCQASMAFLKITGGKDGSITRLCNILKNRGDASFKTITAQAKEKMQLYPTLEKPLNVLKEGVTLEQAGMFDDQGVPENIVKEYIRLKVPFSNKTNYKNFQDSNLQSDLQKLGSGAYNTVYKGTYELEDSTLFTGVFKEEMIQVSVQSDHIGIDGTNTQLGARNIATSKLNDLLNFNVIPRTEFGIHEGKLGVIMEIAPGVSPLKDKLIEYKLTPQNDKFGLTDIPDIFTGRSIDLTTKDQSYLDNIAKSYPNIEDIYVKEGELWVNEKELVAVQMNYKDPVLRQELTKLQLLDALTGQVDRHPMNYFISLNKQGEVTGIKGIDNDMVFGKKLVHPNQNRQSLDPMYMRGCGLPPVIDTEMAKIFMELTPEKLEETLEGLITDPEELDSAQKRLVVIKEHIATLEKEGKIIGTDGWGEGKIDAFFTDEDTSYVSRDDSLKSYGFPILNYTDIV